MSDSQKYEYTKNNVVDTCCICRFKIDSNDAIRFIFEGDYLQQMEALTEGDKIKKLFDENSTSVYKYEDNYLNLMIEAYHEIKKLENLNHHELIHDDTLDNLDTIYRYDFDLFEYLKANGFESIKEFKAEVNVVTEKLSEHSFEIKLIHYIVWKKLKEKIHFSTYFLNEISKWKNKDHVIHHDHYTGKILGFAHATCNKKLRQVINNYTTCVYAHNSRNFDLKFILLAINLSEWNTLKTTAMGKSSVETIKVGDEAEFRNTLKFFAASLDSLGKSADEHEKQIILEHIERIVVNHPKFNVVYQNQASDNDNKEMLLLLCKKGAIPYDMFKDGSELESICYLPSKECFSSKLKTSVEISTEVYENVKQIWERFNSSNLNDLNYLYNMTDIILLNVLC